MIIFLCTHTYTLTLTHTLVWGGRERYLRTKANRRCLRPSPISSHLTQLAWPRVVVHGNCDLKHMFVNACHLLLRNGSQRPAGESRDKADVFCQIGMWKSAPISTYSPESLYFIIIIILELHSQKGPYGWPSFTPILVPYEVIVRLWLLGCFFPLHSSLYTFSYILPKTWIYS